MSENNYQSQVSQMLRKQETNKFKPLLLMIPDNLKLAANPCSSTYRTLSPRSPASPISAGSSRRAAGL